MDEEGVNPVFEDVFHAAKLFIRDQFERDLSEFGARLKVGGGFSSEHGCRRPELFFQSTTTALIFRQKKTPPIGGVSSKGLSRSFRISLMGSGWRCCGSRG